MKLILLCTLFFSLAASSVPAQTRQAPTAGNSNAEQALINLTRSFDEARLKGDVKALDRILSDEYATIHGHEGLRKADLLSAWFKDVAYDSFRREIEQVRLYQDSAIVFASIAASGKRPKSNGESFTSKFNSIDVWVRQKGRWRCVLTMTSDSEGGNKR
jgi:hypothetical protein